MSDALPKWPERAIYFDSTFAEQFMTTTHIEAAYYEDMSDAAIARLRVAQEFIESTSCAQLHHSAKERHLLSEPCPVERRRDDLLADLLPKESET